MQGIYTNILAENPASRGAKAYAQAVLANALTSIRQSVQGSRNITLSKCAYGVARVVHLGLDRDGAARQLIEAALAVGLPQSEATNTVKNAFAKGERNPKAVEGLSSRAFYQAPRVTPKPQPDQTQATRLKTIWEGAKPSLPGDLVHTYLQARGLSITPPDTLRLAWLDYWEPDLKLGRYPVMLAQVVHPVYGLVALHRTYLDRSGKGKATVPNSKKLTKAIFEGAVMGGAIQLYPASTRLALAEGIETALAVHQELGTWPVWATVSAGGLERVVLPKGVQEVSIWADHDKAGLEAAQKAARRFLDEGRSVRVLKPPKPGSDWLDVLGGGL